MQQTLKEAPEQMVLGSGADQVIMKPRRPEDTSQVPLARCRWRSSSPRTSMSPWSRDWCRRSHLVDILVGSVAADGVRSRRALRHAV